MAYFKTFIRSMSNLVNNIGKQERFKKYFYIFIPQIITLKSKLNTKSIFVDYDNL